jgi:hypothetical protein
VGVTTTISRHHTTVMENQRPLEAVKSSRTKKESKQHGVRLRLPSPHNPDACRGRVRFRDRGSSRDAAPHHSTLTCPPARMWISIGGSGLTPNGARSRSRLGAAARTRAVRTCSPALRPACLAVGWHAGAGPGSKRRSHPTEEAGTITRPAIVAFSLEKAMPNAEECPRTHQTATAGRRSSACPAPGHTA